MESPPDWATFPFDVACRPCGYNLRELTVNRCPECGREFSWADEIERARSRRSPIFEFQARRRPVRSFLQTTLWLHLPWRFWRRVPASLPPRMGVLLVQLIATTLSCGLLLLLTDYANDRLFMLWYRGRWPSYPFDWCWSIERIRRLFIPIAGFGLLTWLALILFWRSLAAHHVGHKEVFRLVVCSFSSLLLGGAVSLAALRMTRLLGTMLFRYVEMVAYQPSYLALLLFFISLARGLRLRMSASRAWRLAFLVVLLASTLMIYAGVQSGLYFNSFDYDSNPVILSLIRVMPPVWLWIP